MMKKWFAAVLIVCVVAAVQAGQGEGSKGGETNKGKGHGKKEMNKKQFCAQQKRMSEKKGREYNQAAAEKRFDKMDKNKDGKLSADERPKGKNKGKGKGKDKNKGGGQGKHSEEAAE